MRTKHLLMALALPTVFAACTADDILEQGSNVNNMAARKAVGEISFVNSDIQSRLVFDNGLKWTAEDKLGAALMDQWNGKTTNANPAADYTIKDVIYSNYQYDYDGTGFSNGNAVLVEGNYFVYAQFNKNQKRSGLAYSIEANQTTGTAGYDAWYKNQFFLDHIFVKQGDSQVGVNVLPVFPKVNMAIAYEGATSGIEVRKVIVHDETGKFALNGAVMPEAKNEVVVDYNALANVGTITVVDEEKFNLANYTVTGKKTLADVFNAYKKALKDYADGVFTLAEGKSEADFVSPNIAAFIKGERAAKNITLNYTTPAASVKGVMVLPLSESHTVSNLVIEIYTNKGLVTIAGNDANTMSKGFNFEDLTITIDDEVVAGKAYTESYKADPEDLEGHAYDAIRFNAGIKNAFVAEGGMKADGLQKVEIGFKENAILVPNRLTVTTTEELKYYLANWYAGKKNQIVGGANPEDKNIVTVIAAPGEGQKVEIDDAVLSFINNENNPRLKFVGTIEIKAGTPSSAINKIVSGGELTVINNATQTWTAAQAFTNLTNKGTLTVGTGAQGEPAYTVANAIVNEGTLTINKTLNGDNSVYNAGTLNVNANLGTLVNGAKKAAPAEDEIVAAAVANLNGGKTVSTLTNYATVNVANAVVGALTNNATVNANGAFKVNGASVNNATITIAATSTMTVTGEFTNAKDATITNNKSLNASKGGILTNNGKIVNNGEASCNADGSKFINNNEIEALTKSITLVSLNNEGAEILVADKTALVTIPNAADSEGRVTFIVDEQADLANIPSCANSLRVTASNIDFSDADAATTGKQDIKMTAKKHLEFRSNADMNINCYLGSKTVDSTPVPVYTEFEHVYFNAANATSEVRFTVYGTLVAEKALDVTENAMIIVNDELTYSDYAYNFNNAGRLYVIGNLTFTNIVEPSTEGLAFMGNVFCTGGDDANITWKELVKASEKQAVVATEDDLAEVLTNWTAVETITLAGKVSLANTLSIGKSVTIKGGTFSGATVNVTSAADKIKFEGVTFENSSTDDNLLAWENKTGSEVIIEGCTFKGTYDWDAVKFVDIKDGATIKIINNKFEAPTKANADGSYIHIAGITTDQSTGKVEITGNKFGAFDNFADNPIKCYGLKEFNQYTVGKNTFVTPYSLEAIKSQSDIPVYVAKGTYYDDYAGRQTKGVYTWKAAYDAFVASTPAAL